jgi:hypothetical protein
MPFEKGLPDGSRPPTSGKECMGRSSSLSQRTKRRLWTLRASSSTPTEKKLGGLRSRYVLGTGSQDVPAVVDVVSATICACGMVS